MLTFEVAPSSLIRLLRMIIDQTLSNKQRSPQHIPGKTTTLLRIIALKHDKTKCSHWRYPTKYGQKITHTAALYCSTDQIRPGPVKCFAGVLGCYTTLNLESSATAVSLATRATLKPVSIILLLRV